MAVCGFATCVLTALLLWWIEIKYGFAFYAWTFWFIIPGGAFLSGIAGGSGYYIGAWYAGHRPTRSLLLNTVVASVTTFFFIHYLSYLTLHVDGQHASEFVSFWRYLDISIRSTSMEFRAQSIANGQTGPLGALGYAFAGLQILGFAAGGWVVYKDLAAKPYCERCSRYLSAKGTQTRYTSDAAGLQAVTAKILEDDRNGALVSALEKQKAFGNPRAQKGDGLRSVIQVRYCKKCGRHWIRFSVQKKSGNGWKLVPGVGFSQFTEQAVNL